MSRKEGAFQPILIIANRLARDRLRLLKLEYAPTIALILAVAQMASFADQGVFQLSYAVAGLFSFVSLVSGVAVFLYLKEKDVTAARVAISTGVLFFILLFGFGEYLFATYFPS
jgi:hypothetical protein